MPLRSWMANLIEESKNLNDANILDLLEKDSTASLVDLGCGDGLWTVEVGKKIGTDQVWGADVVDECLDSLGELGINPVKVDLNEKLPFDDESFDVVHLNQVVEHVFRLGILMEEVYRIMKKGGYAVVSTENLSSWHNIVSLFFGWQPFSSSNFVPHRIIGNPFSLNRYLEEIGGWELCHNKVMAYRGLVELFTSYGFVVEVIRGSGYYPLPAFFGDIDKRHCHWISFKIRKP